MIKASSNRRIIWGFFQIKLIRESKLKCKLAMILFTTLSLNGLQAQVGELIWEENFDHLDNWTPSIGNGAWGWGNGELEFYQSQNVEVSEIPDEAGNMALRITARAESGSWIVDQWGNPLSYTSGKVTSKSKVAVQYGLIETRVKLPNLNLGGWPAIWLLGESNYGWPYNGEMDIVEMGSSQGFRDLHDGHNGGNGLNNSNVNQVTGANAIFHAEYAINPDNPLGAASISWDPDDEYCRPYYNYDDPLVERFVIYRSYWDQDSLRFTVVDEGIEYDLFAYAFPLDSLSSEFQQPFYFIANLAIGGAYTDAYNLGDLGSGLPISMPLPAEMYVDYIRVYEWNGQGEVRLGPPFPESGSFGIFTDETGTNGGLEPGVSSEIFVWENTLNEVSIAPYEGENGLSWQTTGEGWFGAGIMSIQPLNMINFGEGHLNFRIQIPANISFKIGIIDGWDNQNYLEFPANTTSYGLVRDGQWGQASIPISELRGSFIDLRMLSYAFVILEESGGACEFALDDIYWDGGGIPNAPLAYAGLNQIVEDLDGNGSEAVTLDGSASSDPDGTIDSYQWTVADTLLASGVSPTVNLELGEHHITLTVTDDLGNSASDIVQITVLDNYLPLAHAGSDQTLIDSNNDGRETVALDGTASTDSDGSVVAYSWSENGNVIATGEQVSLELALGVHVITLTVTDNDGGVGTDALTIRVNPNFSVSAPAIYFTHSAPSIDEIIEPTWLYTPGMEINNVTVGSRTADFDAQWRALYDFTNLYILVEVNDHTLVNDSNNEWYNDDCVEIFIDGDNSSGSMYDGVNDFQFGFRWADEEIKIGNNSANNMTGMNVIHYATDVGHNLELSIPWNTIGVTPSEGYVIGFDVAVDDDDNGGTRECAIASIFTADNAWHNPGVFGNVALIQPTGISNDGSHLVPPYFQLSQNFPNPFNPQTSIRFSLVETERVDLSIYNIRGQVVANLVDCVMHAGEHTIAFDGSDLASGSYFYSISTGSRTAVRKMLLIK